MVKNPLANTQDAGSIPELGRSLGEGNNNPLQYSCLENPMDRGTVACWATVHGVAKSQTRVAKQQTYIKTGCTCVLKDFWHKRGRVTDLNKLGVTSGVGRSKVTGSMGCNLLGVRQATGMCCTTEESSQLFCDIVNGKGFKNQY